MNRDSKKNRRLMFAVLAGALALGSPLTILTASAADLVEVRAEKVPAAVMETARKQILDSHDVVFRKEEDASKYRVYFTTPTNLRLIAKIRGDGTLQEAPELGSDQVAGAPKGKEERERLLGEWNKRVILAQQPPPRVIVVQPPPVAPPPPVMPPQPIPANLPPAPVVFTNTPINATEIPGVALSALDKFTGGSKDVRYFRQQADAQFRYEADFTTADGSRREVVVADTGALLAGPLILRETVTDDDLKGDLGSGSIPQPTQWTPLQVRDVPPRAIEVMNRYTTRSTDLRYRRDTFPDRSIGYTVHWVLPDNGRRYWTTVRDDGSVLVPPRLSNYQPDAVTDAEGIRSARVAWKDLPDRVKLSFQLIARTDANATYYRQTREGNKVYFGSEFQEGGKKMWMRVDDQGKVIAGPALADKGRDAGPARDPRDAIPKAVDASIASHTNGGKNVVTTKRTEGGRTVYHVAWADAQNDKHEMRLDEKGEVIVNAPATPKKK